MSSDDASRRGLSSPPCYAADFPGYFGDASLAPEVVARLNALLEAERAGAKVLRLLARELPDDAPARALLESVCDDEGDNAVALYRTIRRLGGEASAVTGAFVEKTLAIEGLEARLRFVNTGQQWVVRKIDELLPLVHDGAARAMLDAMRQSHRGNIAACDAFLAASDR